MPPVRAGESKTLNGMQSIDWWVGKAWDGQSDIVQS